MNDLWEELKEETLPVLVYGMGNGADKLFEVCEKKGVRISGVFCSDGFERSKLFHGMPVISYSAAKNTFGRFTALLAFGSSRDDVLSNIKRVSEEQRLYVPDLPVAGETLFDRAFYVSHKDSFDRARALFSDDRSSGVFDAVVNAKLHGRLSDLERETSPLPQDFKKIFHAEILHSAADLGAYDGDSAMLLFELCPALKTVTAFEPDPKTYARLLKNTKDLPVRCLPYAAWDKEETLAFAQGGNRGSGISSKGKKNVSVRCVRGDGVFEETGVDFIKIDVEGAERRALEGLAETIVRDKPEMLISCYHRPEDLFELPLLIAERFPFYRLFLRRQRGVPAWDVNLFCAQI